MFACALVMFCMCTCYVNLVFSFSSVCCYNLQTLEQDYIQMAAKLQEANLQYKVGRV